MEFGFKSLKVYKMAFKAACEIYRLSSTFPKEELYSLTDQIRRSSRSVCTCIGEGYRKRRYPKYFSLKMSDADGECTETIIWLDFSLSCGYIAENDQRNMNETYQEIGKMLSGMAEHPEKFFPKPKMNGYHIE
jgi:four helix bundle protein